MRGLLYIFKRVAFGGVGSLVIDASFTALKATFCGILLFICGLSALHAQDYKPRFLSLQEGLSNQQVLDIAHDDNGFVWMATELGLNRFASNSFQNYFKGEKNDGTSVNSNEINTLLYDEGKLYIGTRADGLNVLDLKTNRFTYYQHRADDDRSIATNDVTDILKGRDGYLWLATYHQGIQRFDPVKKEFVRYNQKQLPQLPENGIWALAEDGRGFLYAGHVSKGISIFDKKKHTLRSLTRHNGLPDDEVKVLFCDHRNNIWIGTRRGLAVYRPEDNLVQPIRLAQHSKTAKEPFVYSIKEIGQTIYVGAESSQLFTVHPSYAMDGRVSAQPRVQVQDLDRGRNSSVQDIAPDRFGNMWLALYGGGVGFIGHMKPFFSIFPSKDRPGFGNLSTVSGIVEAEGGNIWLATEGDGMVEVGDDGPIGRQTAQNSALPDDFLLSLYKDSRGNRWCGLQKGGVAVFDVLSQRWGTVQLGEPATEVRAMLEDSRGKIWFAAQQGLFIYDPLTQRAEKLLVNRPMLGDYAPRSLVEDSFGHIWVGTYGQGLYVFSAERQVLHKFSTDNGLKSNTVNHLFRDRNNNIWIATNEGIAFHSVNQDVGELLSLTPDGPSAWSTVNAMSEDRNGNIWCSTKAGLLRYLPSEKRFLQYDVAFGLPLGGFINSSVATGRDGRLFFGMHEGVCSFNPAEIPIKLKPSPIRISRFMVFQAGEPKSPSIRYAAADRRIALRYDENSFRVELAVMDYAMNDLVEFSYKLQGLDADWIFLGEEKNLDFRNIPYGSYELRVRTRLKNGDWSADYQHLFVKIAPPFYLSTWAWLLYAAVAGSVAFVLIFFYIKKIKAEADLRLKESQIEQDELLYAERLNFYTNITHELRTPLTLILGPLDDLLQEDKLATKQKSLIQVVQKSANRLFGLVNQLLEFRKVESRHKSLILGEGYLGEMLREIVQRYQELNAKKDLSVDIELPDEELKTSFDAEIVQLIVDNLMANAYKYTEAGRVVLRLRYEQDAMSTWSVIEVSDTGCGIDEAHVAKVFDKFYQVPHTGMQGTGVGLALVKELVAIHQGKVTVHSVLRQGTTFCVKLLTNQLSARQLSEAGAKAVEQDEQAADNQQTLILLVEDDLDLRDYLAATLRVHYDVIVAKDGLEGFTLAVKHIPDLILSDVMMPDMDGFELLGKLKSKRETSHIPLVLLTAKDAEQDRQRGYDLGADSYLHKPVSSQLLYRRIENLLLKRKATYAEVLLRLSDGNTASAIPASTAEALPTASEDLWRENAFVQDFVRIVEQHIQDEVLDAAALAEKMNMSQSTLYRKLKGISGKNINQLVRKVRIQKAGELLRSGQYNITEVSFMVGINSAIYFRQCFKEEFGQLPSEYQKNYANR